MNQDLLVSVVILHYGHPDVTAECLQALFGQEHHTLEIFLIDNHSKEGLDSLPQIEDERVTLIRTEENTGYAAGNNIGISQSTGDYIVIINNDVILPEGWIGKMLDAWPSEEWGLLSSCITRYGSDQILQYGGFSKVSELTGRNEILEAGNAWSPREEVLPTPYAHGSAMMVSRAALATAGPIPEQYFLQYEELDWSEKIRRKGFQVGVYWGINAPHYGSLTLGKDSTDKWYYYHRGRLIFQRRWLPLWKKPLFLGYYFFLAVPKEILSHLAQRKFGHLRAWGEAVVWHLRHLRKLPARSTAR